MDRHPNSTSGRPRSHRAATPELVNASSLRLARWAAAAASAGLTRSSAAKVAGVTRRTLQRALAAHGADPLVVRDLQLGEALKWESAGGQALEEAVSRSMTWLRSVSSDPRADVRELVAALGATVAAAHRLTEAGSRRAKRLQPEKPQPQNQFDHQALLSAVAQACEEARTLPPGQQGQAFEAIHQQLCGNHQMSIDVEVVEPLATVDSDSVPQEPARP